MIELLKKAPIAVFVSLASLVTGALLETAFDAQWLRAAFVANPLMFALFSVALLTGGYAAGAMAHGGAARRLSEAERQRDFYRANATLVMEATGQQLRYIEDCQSLLSKIAGAENANAVRALVSAKLAEDNGRFGAMLCDLARYGCTADIEACRYAGGAYVCVFGANPRALSGDYPSAADRKAIDDRETTRAIVAQAIDEYDRGVARTLKTL